MEGFILAKSNGRKIPKEDKIFGINTRAKKLEEKIGKENVVNASVGALLDDDGNLIVLSSVTDVIKNINDNDYAPYAPITGTDGFKKAIKKAVFADKDIKGFTEVVATPGGTGAIRNAIANYTEYGDSIITADWYWATYKSIANELGRDIDEFQMIKDGAFNLEGFEKKVNQTLETKESVMIILNTPAHNPTGYSITEDEWKAIKKIISKNKNKKIIIFVDVAYIDFAGSNEHTRGFLKIIEDMPENVLTIIGYSTSKTFTFYGMRCGAMVCLSANEKIAEEFKLVCQYSSRATWSNCNRMGMYVIEKIMNDKNLNEKVDNEREIYRQILDKRGKIFDDEAKKIGLDIVPFDSGFFISIPCDEPEKICEILEKKGIFLVPLKKGIRVSVASISENICRELPSKIYNAIKEAYNL